MNFATLFAASCLTLSVAIPGGLYVAGEVQHRIAIDRPSGPPTVSLWIATPSFTLMDSSGGRHGMVAAVGTHSRDEAARLCKYMPIVRDRLQRFASTVRVTGIEAGQPQLRGDPDALAATLAEALGFKAAPKVKIIDSRQSVQTVIKVPPAKCENGKLAT